MRLRDATEPTVALPDAQLADVCLLLPAALWQSFRELSLWIEALCIHEWCLFTESVRQDQPALAERGRIYSLLTTRPGNRRPLTWERNGVDVLLLEGRQFECPWTHKRLVRPGTYDLDHLLPLAVYPINELWNLLPVDPVFNRTVKRDRLPTPQRLLAAQARFQTAYHHYEHQPALQRVLRADVWSRFANLGPEGDFAAQVARHAVGFIEGMASGRNIKRF